MTRSARLLFSFALTVLSALAATAQAAGPAASVPLTALRVEHQLSSLGTDGIQRDMRFAERVYRQGDRVWIARELPPASAHAEHDATNTHAGHKHADTDTAPRWIERDAKGALTVRVVSESQQKNYNVLPAEYSNIGFDGSWATAYHLLDPAALKGMRAEGPVRNGVQTYRSTQGERTVTLNGFGFLSVDGQLPRVDIGGTVLGATHPSALPTTCLTTATAAGRWTSRISRRPIAALGPS